MEEDGPIKLDDCGYDSNEINDQFIDGSFKDVVLPDLKSFKSEKEIASHGIQKINGDITQNLRYTEEVIARAFSCQFKSGADLDSFY